MLYPAEIHTILAPINSGIVTDALSEIEVYPSKFCTLCIRVLLSKSLLTRKKAESFAPNLFILMQRYLDTVRLHPDQA